MRKEKLITISSGRDEGKKFKIREMGAVKTEKWATRALMLLASSNIDLGVDKDELKGVEGWSNIAKAGFFSSDRTIAEYNRDIWKLK